MQIKVGANCLDQLASMLKELGSERVLLVTSPSRRHLDRALAALKDFHCSVFDQAVVHVPEESVSSALDCCDADKPDTILAIGGGAAIGLGKALCLKRDLKLVAVPTTYSGTERTNVFGIRVGGEKKTGRDERVRPSLVVYDPSLSVGLPVKLTVQSLVNSMAQVVSAMSTGSVPTTGEFAEVLDNLWKSIQALTERPDDLDLRELALISSGRAGTAIDKGTLGAQHSIAHAIGGRFNLEHSAVHSVVLPSFLAHLRREHPEMVESIDRACRLPETEAAIYDRLRQLGAVVSLQELGVSRNDIRSLLDDRQTLPADVVWDAYYGIRPSSGGIMDRRDGEPTCLRVGDPITARFVVLALHGRGANVGRMLRDVRGALKNPESVAYILPQAIDCVWYPKPYSTPLAEQGAYLEQALLRVQGLLDELEETVGLDRVVLFGFSQGACLALETLARRSEARLLCLVAAAGARIGIPTEVRDPRGGKGTPMIIGAAQEDPWLDNDQVKAAAEGFKRIGAEVETIVTPGSAHSISSEIAEAVTRRLSTWRID